MSRYAESLVWAAEHAGKHPCELCGAPVKVFPPYYYRNRLIPKYCSRQCRGRADRKLSEVKCAVCEKAFHAPPSQAKNRVTCSRECYRQLQRQWYSKDGNPNWRGGVRQIRVMIRNSPLYDRFRVDVLVRDGYSCQHCGLQSAKRRRTNTLDVHHVVSVDYLLSKIFDPANGIALCPDCHTAEHSQPS